MDRETELRNTAIKVNLKETFKIIDLLESPQAGIINSAVPTINGLEITFQKKGRVLDFTTGSINDVGPPGPIIYQNSNYGLSSPFEIEWNNKKYSIANGTGKGAVHIGRGFTTSGELYEFDGLDKKAINYWRAILPLPQPMKPPVQYMIGKHFLVGTALRIAGLVRLNINGTDFQLYDYDKNKKPYLIFESLAPVTFDTFQTTLQSVLFNYGFVSGALVQNEIIVFQAEDIDFSSITGFEFKRLRDNVDSQVELISPREHKEYYSLGERIFLPEKVFARLIQQSLDDKRILRAVKLISQARGIPPELEASCHCVALETIKGVIIQANETKVTPIPDKEIARNLKKQMKQVVASYAPESFNDVERVNRKVDAINQVGNTESFILSFELLGIPLSKEEKGFLGSRNNFLHGDIPFGGEDPTDPHQFTLHKISLHIQLLTSCLILKMAGYTGPVKNFWKYWQMHLPGNNDTTPLFKNI